MDVIEPNLSENTSLIDLMSAYLSYQKVQDSWDSFLNSPQGSVFKVALVVAIVELVIMIAMGSVLMPVIRDRLTPLFWNLLDPLTLVILVTPALSLFVLRPLQEQKALISQQLDSIRLAAITFEMHDAIMIGDAKGVIIKTNQSFINVTGLNATDVIGENILFLIPERSAMDGEIWNKLEITGEWSGEIWIRDKTSQNQPYWLSITAARNDQHITTNYVGVITDISEHKQAKEEIKNLAFYDVLTGLPNRRLFLDRFRAALPHSARTNTHGVILFIDLDNFKTLNDTLGHDIGDQLLQMVAKRMLSCVREVDTVARVGGDEFVVMMEDLSAEPVEAALTAEMVGNKILAELNKFFALGSHEWHCTPSIGATLFDGRQHGLDELMKQADIAMYQAKSAGRNTLRFFDPEMQAGLIARVALERELRKALDAGQFQLYYQIQVDRMRRPIGAEALIRWHHPEYGMVSPAAFIPLAEETGMIMPIGLWVLENACAQINKWQSDQDLRHMQLAVNVSARQFHQSDFVGQVINSIKKFQANPMLLKLELTESVVLDKLEDTVQKMNQLKDIGLKLSLDDFGTGYSSLSYLKSLPLDQVKIDQGFVRNLTENRGDAVMIQTIVDLGINFELEVIAEGVETETQYKLLQRYGCASFQGYLFSKPVPVDQFEALVRQ